MINRIFALLCFALLCSCDRESIIVSSPEQAASEGSYQVPSSLQRGFVSIEEGVSDGSNPVDPVLVEFHNLLREATSKDVDSLFKYRALNGVNWLSAFKLDYVNEEKAIYTMPIVAPGKAIQASFQNLIVEYKGGQYNAFVIAYEPTLDHLESEALFSNYSGNVHVIDAFQDTLASAYFTNGEKVNDQPGSTERVACTRTISIIWTEVCWQGNCNISELEITISNDCPIGRVSTLLGSPLNTLENSPGSGGGGTTVGAHNNNSQNWSIWPPSTLDNRLILCDDIVFGHLNDGNAWYATVENLGMKAFNNSTGDSLVVNFTGCVQIPDHYASFSWQAAELFTDEFNATVDEIDVLLNSGSITPSQVVLQNELKYILQQNLNIVASGSTFSSGPCQGSSTIPVNTARYGTWPFGCID